MDSPDEAERESEPYSDEGFEVYQEGSSAVKGTCQEVEKSYFRLTSKPDPSVVRPEPVLQRALTRLVRDHTVPLHICFTRTPLGRTLLRAYLSQVIEHCTHVLC